MGESTQEYITRLEKENKDLTLALQKEKIRKEDAYRREDNLQEINTKLSRTKFTRFNEEECWIFNEEGENYLRSLLCPVVVSPVYMQILLETLWESNMWLNFVIEEEGYLWEEGQYTSAVNCTKGANILLKAFEKENDGSLSANNKEE